MRAFALGLLWAVDRDRYQRAAETKVEVTRWDPFLAYYAMACTMKLAAKRGHAPRCKVFARFMLKSVDQQSHC